MLSVDTDGEKVEKIDLYNFEEPRFENSRYCLTSPRSLEACSRLNVKPVELLYKPLTEFQEELLPQDVPLRTIYNIYDEQEQIRLRKLHLCREERGRISKDEIQEITAKGKKAGSKNVGSNITKASLERQRTAWSTGVGHKRVTKDELNKRASELQDESVKLRKELLSRKEGRPQKPTTRRPRSARPTSRQGSRTTLTRSKSTSEIYSKLPARDRKILDLMKSKREDEQQRLEVSERSRLLWEDEKKRQEALRIVMENKRRKLLARKNFTQDAQQLQESQRRQQLEEKEKHHKEENMFLRSKLTDEALYKQLKTQERNLDFQDRDAEDMMKRVDQLSKSNLTRASQRKDMGIYQDSLRKSVSNLQSRNAFELRRREQEKDTRKHEKAAHCVMELRHSQAEENLANLLETRNQQLMASHFEEEKKLEKARQSQQKLEEDMEGWRRRLLQHKRRVEKQAERAAQVNKFTRAERVRQERLAHEQEQKKKLEKLSKEQDQWRRSLRKSLTEKDRKILEIQHQKDNYISQTRSMAQMSQMLRDKVRNKYEHDTFDRKVLDAQLFAKLEQIPPAKRLSKAS
ncbi:coiled-coil domain-containing protein 177-like isoform X2 [Littorina saxatilis]|uniref:Uncharacterized protein n=1 Tax=Littorina saxatilis TaxID=31220 RepID=A0AAN9C0K6_9CAEN